MFLNFYSPELVEQITADTKMLTRQTINHELSDNYFCVYKDMLENSLSDDLSGYSFSVRKMKSKDGIVKFVCRLRYDKYVTDEKTNALKFIICPYEHQPIIESSKTMCFEINNELIRIPIFGTRGKFSEILRLVHRIKNHYVNGGFESKIENKLKTFKSQL